MKKIDRNSDTEQGNDSGQMILLAGFVIAVTLVSLAVVVGSGFFSQASPDDGGLSSLTSQVTDQVDTAREVGLETVDFVNENKTREEGANVTEVCEDIIDNTEVQQQVAEQLSEEEVLLDIKLKNDCDELNDTSSYRFGQQKAAPLPGVNLNKTEDVTKNVTCTNLRSEDWTNFDNKQDDFNAALMDVVRNETSGDEIPDDYNETADKKDGSTEYSYTQHKKEALRDIGITGDDLPDTDDITLNDFAEDCLSDSQLKEPKTDYACADLRGEVGFNDSTFELFNEEFEEYLRDNVGGDGIPADYNETKNSNYSYTNHTLDILEELNSSDEVDIDLTKLPDGVTKRGFAGDCIILEAEEGRAPVDVVFSIDTTGSMGLDPGTEVDSDYNSDYDDDYSPSEAGTPIVQGHNERVNEYPSTDPYNIGCYKEYNKTGVPFPTSAGPYGDQDAANQGWCAGEYLGNTFNTSVGQVGDFVYDDPESELVKVTNIPPAGPPAGIPTSWTPVTTPGVDTSDPSEYPVGAPNDCASEPCDTRTTGGTVSVGDVVIGAGSGAGNYPDSDETVEVLDDVGGVSGVPTSYETLNDPGDVGTSTEKDDICVDGDGDRFPCDTNTDGSVNPSSGDILEVDHSGLSEPASPPDSEEPVIAEVTGLEESNRCFGFDTIFGCLGPEDDVYNIDTGSGTYEAREDALGEFEYRVDTDIDYKVGDGSGTAGYADESQLEFFEYKWDQPSPQVEVEDESGSTRMEPVSNLDYIEYRWWPPDRLYLTQLGARAAMEDLVVGEDRVGLVQYSTSIYGDADTVEDMANLTSGYKTDLKEDIDGLRPGSGTDITEGIEEARNALETSVCKGTADRDATCHIVVMSDGEQTDGEDPYPDDYLENNDDYENVTVHAIALGEGADDDMMEEIANPDGGDSVRPEGVFESSNDPEEAKGIFEDVIGSINKDRGNTTQGIDAINDTGNVTGVSNNVTAGGDDGEFENVTLEADAGVIQKIYDLGMNITNFSGTGTYSLNLTDAEDGVGETVIWGMTVDNNFTGTKTQVRFRADDDIVEDYDDDDEFLESTFNVSADFSESSVYASVELAPNPRFKMANGSGVKFSSNDDYDITRVIDDVIQPQINSGVAVKMGTGNTPEAEANGTFSFDFKPVGGNFSLVGDAAGGVCGEDDDGTMVTCGVEDTDNGTYATAQAKEVSFIVTVEGPGGVSEREIEVRIEDALIGGGS
ncbi:VWA domain-containing protein [Haladaptatus sp. F3-133]|uniref:VWA domain-containing protein n=1 Tax=Halorutilus salinus TaxID=2487751 RepID=A0A9Q4C6W9_9EURY|nr:vWA domain-containing protein [Halorutilus salinus]MCX2819519.1 VWA domain-containing protein [Halorutilus salinus]